MRINLKNQKGITMITLTIAIIILVLVSNILIYNGKDGVYAKKLENMYNDIESLRDKVVEYYVQYGRIPADTNIEYQLDGKADLKNNWVSTEENEAGKFYVIDLKALEGVTLNYGKDYQKISSTMSSDEISKLTDIYIVNDVTQNVFYVKGIKVKDKTYYSDREKDETVIDLKYIDGIEIPEGYSYLSGTKNRELKIKNDATGDEYTWISVDKSIEEIPEEVKTANPEEFINSVNKNRGYFITQQDGEENVAYIQENE